MNVMIAQSGGPTPVINMSLRGAVEKALGMEAVDKIYGSRNGVEGILHDDLVHLHEKAEDIRRASQQPGAILGGSRHSLTENEVAAIAEKLKELNVGIFCYIGGNGSSRTVKELHRHAVQNGINIQFVHIPKTIDNDLYGIDHTPGFGSAAKFVSHMVQWIGMDMASMKSYDKVEIVEVMGGNSGWLAAATAIAKRDEADYPQIVYMPEQEVRLEEMLAQIETVYSKTGSVMMIVPDHLKIPGLRSDAALGHPRSGYNGGISYKLAGEVKQRLGLKTRVTSPGTLYRTASCMASECDLSEAYRLGAEAVRFAAEGYSGGMVTLDRVSDSPYECRIDWADLEHIAGKERPLPAHYWDAQRQMPTPAFIDYILPLVDGQIIRPVIL
ncbi:diphosphate--fructose-6-phosphate 1-phosphotransferase [Paenibacillus hamazuiensis]|uniref:diphosphate--fructose-6-phosphate 1-phosphotransferase n=1 Tax=Paenibacillus hamazuiensis TaxID=2936508 RepID=UPI00200D4A5B|nr:diphosphate--fructose-6-phosphate 1-phosphotransferase [Paenibacillus hamazuiensis]